MTNAGEAEAAALPAPPSARGDRLAAVASPIAAFATLLIAWQFGVRAAGVPEYILPLPTEFLAELWTDRVLAAEHSWVTAKELVLSFLMATAISIPLGFTIVSWRALQRALYPLIVFFQLIPKIAIAPLFVVWFGFGMFPIACW